MSEYFFKRIENIFFISGKEKRKKDPHREKFSLTFNIFQYQKDVKSSFYLQDVVTFYSIIMLISLRLSECTLEHELK